MTVMNSARPIFPRTPLDGSGGSGKTGEKTASNPEQEIESEEVILCRQCTHPITSPRERMDVQGAHHHTFANPHGLVFEIGCYKEAGGCAVIGPYSDDFTWFRGFSWQVAVCASCLTHLGWRFASGAGEHFHGLILNRLTGI